jgi:erythromycin esterase-like protein
MVMYMLIKRIQAMLDQTTSKLADLVRTAARPLTGAPHDYDALLDLIGDARVVLIGEASHGTHEFYRERAQITKRLIAERGFAAVAVEADWPDAYQINRYVRGEASPSAAAIDALAGFQRFPTWMWRNADVLDFVGWLRAHNDAQPRAERKAGLYGLDLYSLHTSIAAVISYLEHVDPPAAQRARERYGCLEYFGSDPQLYGYATSLGEAETCEDEVVSQLVELQRRTAELLRGDGQLAEDAFSRPSKTRAWLRMPRRITGRCFVAGMPRGTCAIGIWPKRWTPWSRISAAKAPRRSWWSGPIIRTLAMRVPPRWSNAAN